VTIPTPSDWTSQLRRGVLELCILRLLRHRPSYGYEIVTTLDSLGPLATGENTVYPLLRRLKADRYLETEGRRRLAAIEREWSEMVLAVERAIVKAEVA
jgi:PadR family transcriptional regulator PadR